MGLEQGHVDLWDGREDDAPGTCQTPGAYQFVIRTMTFLAFAWLGSICCVPQQCPQSGFTFLLPTLSPSENMTSISLLGNSRYAIVTLIQVKSLDSIDYIRPNWNRLLVSLPTLSD
jgi:hypothetical protein